MVTNHITVLCILLLSSLPHDASIVKNIPGFHGDLPFTLETGYVGVGAEDEVQLFYYFVESERDPLHDPLILYITGGPGTTAVYPFLFQIGPVSVNHDNSTWEKVSLELNPNSWAKTANVIYFDQPAGTGFSYATTYEAWKSSDSILAQQSYNFLIKWIEEHPRFLSNPLYVAGISYMGIVVPLVTLEVYKVSLSLYNLRLFLSLQEDEDEDEDNNTTTAKQSFTDRLMNTGLRHRIVKSRKWRCIGEIAACCGEIAGKRRRQLPEGR